MRELTQQYREALDKYYEMREAYNDAMKSKPPAFRERVEEAHRAGMDATRFSREEEQRQMQDDAAGLERSLWSDEEDEEDDVPGLEKSFMSDAAGHEVIWMDSPIDTSRTYDDNDDTDFVLEPARFRTPARGQDLDSKEDVPERESKDGETALQRATREGQQATRERQLARAEELRLEAARTAALEQIADIVRPYASDENDEMFTLLNEVDDAPQFSREEERALEALADVVREVVPDPEARAEVGDLMESIIEPPADMRYQSLAERLRNRARPSPVERRTEIATEIANLVEEHSVDQRATATTLDLLDELEQTKPQSKQENGVLEAVADLINVSVTDPDARAEVRALLDSIAEEEETAPPSKFSQTRIPRDDHEELKPHSGVTLWDVYNDGNVTKSELYNIDTALDKIMENNNTIFNMVHPYKKLGKMYIESPLPTDTIAYLNSRSFRQKIRDREVMRGTMCRGDQVPFLAALRPRCAPGCKRRGTRTTRPSLGRRSACAALWRW